MNYEYMTTEKLIHTAAWIDTEAVATIKEKIHAKTLIKRELMKRFASVLEFIDDGQNAKNPASSYDRLING